MPPYTKSANSIIILKIRPLSLLFVFTDKEETVPLNFGVMVLSTLVNNLCIVSWYTFCLAFQNIVAKV